MPACQARKRGRIGQLRQTIERDVPRTRALLERTQAALRAYLEQNTPDASADAEPTGPSKPP